jgi:APA family basic amino acid/polyamine antiporter
VNAPGHPETAPADIASDESGFKRVLGTVQLTVLALGAIVGAGIFVVSGTAAAQFAGPAITLSFLCAGIGCAAVGLCFGELAAMLPEVGGVYRYSRFAFGEAIGWVMGWLLVAEFLFGAATIAVSWSADVVAFCAELGVRLPSALTQGAFAAEFGAKVARVSGGGINLPAVLLILGLTAILAGGIRLTAAVNTVMVVVKLAILVAIIAFGLSYVDSLNWTPFIPTNDGSFGRFGWSGIARGAAAVFFAFIGFDVLATVTQEAREPRRSVPIAIVASVVICIVLYVLMGAVITGLVPYRDLNVAHPLLGIVGAPGSPLRWLALPIRLAVMAGLASVGLVLLLAQPRLLFAMARDGLAPASFARLHPTRRVPVAATIACGVVGAVLAGVAPLGLLLDMVSAATLVSFVVVCLAVLTLRHRQPNARRPFRIPLGPVVPLIGLGFSASVMATIQVETWIRLFLWLVLGFAVYFVYARSAAGRVRSSVDRRRTQ